MVLQPTPGMRLVSSLAGRVAHPRLPSGSVRIGGFGGVAGLVKYLHTHEVAGVIDATHPFASGMSHNAACAAQQAGVPLLALWRPGYTEQAGDRWVYVGSVAEAATAAASLGKKVLVTTGRSHLTHYTTSAATCLIRLVDAPSAPVPSPHQVVLDRGPYTVDGERDVMQRNGIDVLTTKDSGGAMTSAKLDAARELGLPVVMVRRPQPVAPTVVSSIDEATQWVTRLIG